jgi:catechol 2,3-dioxygenase-like lactoylglutathione lyase family enzyme
MKQSIVHVALVVRDYDEAIRFYTEKLNFTVVEDTYQPQQDKRWVLVAPPGSNGLTLLLARASAPEQESFIGNQAGGRVFLFLSTDDFWRDYHRMISLGITFVRAPKVESYGTVACQSFLTRACESQGQATGRQTSCSLRSGRNGASLSCSIDWARRTRKWST